MSAWRILLAMSFVLAPLWLIATEPHLEHRVIYALFSQLPMILGLALAQDDGAKRNKQ